MSTIESKLDTIMNRMNNQERRGHSGNEVGVVEGVGQKCATNKGLPHEGPYQVEEAQFLNWNKPTTSSQKQPSNPLYPSLEEP